MTWTASTAGGVGSTSGMSTCSTSALPPMTRSLKQRAASDLG